MLLQFHMLLLQKCCIDEGPTHEDCLGVPARRVPLGEPGKRALFRAFFCVTKPCVGRKYRPSGQLHPVLICWAVPTTAGLYLLRIRQHTHA